MVPQCSKLISKYRPAAQAQARHSAPYAALSSLIPQLGGIGVVWWSWWIVRRKRRCQLTV